MYQNMIHCISWIINLVPYIQEKNLPWNGIMTKTAKASLMTFFVNQQMIFRINFLFWQKNGGYWKNI